MGLAVVLTDYAGTTLSERVDDPKNILHRILPPSDESSLKLLSKIDWYGDTYFNYLQMRLFLEEWDALKQHAESAEEQVLLDAVRQLAVQCQINRTLLRFIGD